MRTRRLRNHLVLAAAFLLPLCVPGLGRAAEENSENTDVWRRRENLVMRLGAEWYKIGLLRRELVRIGDMLEDIGNIELFPPGVTGLHEDLLVDFDKQLEAHRKKHRKLAEKVTALRSPLSDAMAILREMVKGKPVPEMFDVLEQGDVERITHMLEIKHEIDELWNMVDALLSYLSNKMNVRLPVAVHEEAAGIEPEFFEILRANLGLQAREFTRKLELLKDSLVMRGSPEEVEEMFRIELYRVKQLIDGGNLAPAAEKLEQIVGRYQGRRSLNEVHLLHAQAAFDLGNYDEALEASGRLPDEGQYAQERLLLRMQSLYALQDWSAILEWASSFEFDAINGTARNLLLWIVLESQLATETDDSFTRRASHVVPDAPYALHVMHALARYFVRREEWATVLSVVERARRFQPRTEVDKEAGERLRLTWARSLYETGNYRKSLSAFFELLKQEQWFEEGLFGIVWCYLSLEEYDKAETSMRKLINQSPDSPQAAEMFLVMAKRLLNKADYEWEALSSVTREEARLRMLRQRLERKLRVRASGPEGPEIRKALKEVEQLLKEAESRPRIAPEQIGFYYTTAMDLCGLVRKFYQTGSFQETSFSRKREDLLHRLDSLLLGVHEEGTSTLRRRVVFSRARSNVVKIKRLVRRGSMLEAETRLARYRWEQESLKWRKEMLTRRKTMLRDVAGDGDTLKTTRNARLLDSLETTMDSLIEREESLRERRTAALSSMLRTLLREPLEKADEAYVRYHLGELNYARKNASFAREYEKYELELDLYHSRMKEFREGRLNRMPEEPEQPLLDHSRSIAQYRYVLDHFPDVELVPAVRYSLAWCYNDMRMPDSALAQMELVGRNHPGSRYAAQAWMFVGEHAFDRSMLEKAARAYQQVMNYPESDWFDDALYKFAWAQYRLSNPQKAIGSFLALVDLGEDGAAGKVLLENESMDYIAISFSEADITGEKGLTRAAEFIRRFGRRDKGTKILHRLANVYAEQGRYRMAEKAFEKLLEMYPDYERSPVAEMELLQALEKRLNTAEANRRRVALFTKYNSEGDWAKKHSSARVVAAGDSVAATALYDAAVSYHQEALQDNDSASYARAASCYRNFIRHYPKRPAANECHYNYAEILFSLGDYEQAAREYMAVSKRYPDSKFRETAAWNAIVASQNLLKRETEVRQ